MGESVLAGQLLKIPTEAGWLAKLGALASADYTAADVLAKLLTVDGSGSGLDADTVDGSHIATGTYTPSVTLTANLDSATSYPTAYTRVGNRVIVSGYIEPDATAAASTVTELRIDKPIASDLTVVRCGGAAAIAGSGTPVFLGANAATDLIRLVWASPTTAVVGISFIFQYEVV